MGIFLRFKRFFLAQSYFSVIIIHAQSWYIQPLKRRLVGSIVVLTQSFNVSAAFPRKKRLNIA